MHFFSIRTLLAFGFAWYTHKLNRSVPEFAINTLSYGPLAFSLAGPGVSRDLKFIFCCRLVDCFSAGTFIFSSFFLMDLHSVLAISHAVNKDQEKS